MKTAFAGNNSVCIADVSDVFADEKETMYVTTGHLNETGETIVARRLVRELRSCRML